MGVQAAYPFRQAARWRSENDDIEREMLRYRLENQRREKAIKELQTPQGIEREARQYGWVRANEQRLRIPGG